MIKAIDGTAEGFPRPFVARLVKYSRRWKFIREFLDAKRDYTTANSKGSRGIILNYFLDEGEIYEIKEQVSWNRWNHKYVVVTEGQVEEIDEETVTQAINARLA